jgi:hypothetical protein
LRQGKRTRQRFRRATERRGGAGPVRGLLSTQDLTGRLRFYGLRCPVSQADVLVNTACTWRAAPRQAFQLDALFGLESLTYVLETVP